MDRPHRDEGAADRAARAPSTRRALARRPPTLLVLAAACFARLVADPAGLIVDGERPSVDYANRGDPRPVGNDLVFLFLPHHWSIGERIARVRPLAGRGTREGSAGGPLAGNPQAGMSYPPVWLAWWLRAPSALGWLTVAHLLWGGLGVYVLVAIDGNGAMGGDGRGGDLPGVAVSPGSYVRGALSARLGGLLVSLGVLGLSPASRRPGQRAPAGPDPGADLPDRASAGMAAAGHGPVGLGPRGRAAGLAIGRAAAIGRAGRGLAGVPGACRSGWPGSMSRRSPSHGPGCDGITTPHSIGIPRRYHLGGLNAFQLLSPMALGGPGRLFRRRQLLGERPLDRAGAARAGDGRGAAASGSPAGAGLDRADGPGRRVRIRAVAWPLFAVLRDRPRRRADPGAGAIAVPRQPGRCGPRRARPGDAPDEDGEPRCVAAARLATRRGRSSSRSACCWSSSRPVVRPGSSAGQDASADGPAPLRLRPPVGRPGPLRACWATRGSGRRSPARRPGRRRIPADRRPTAPRDHRTDRAGRAGELGWYGFALIRVEPAGRFVGPDPVSAALARLGAEEARSRQVPRIRRPPVRIKARDSFYGDLPASVHGIEKTNIDDAFQLDHAAMLYETLYPVASHVRPMAERRMSPAAKDAWRRIRQAVFDRMSVGFLVSDRVEADPRWPVAAEGMWDDSRFVIQRNASAMPRAYVVPRAILLPDHPGVVLPSLAGLNPRESVVMTADPLAGLASGPRQPFTAAEWTSDDPDRPALFVTTQAPGLLVVADSWMPGWTATVDGRPAPVLRGNYAQRVIPLPERRSARHRHGIPSPRFAPWLRDVDHLSVGLDAHRPSTSVPAITSPHGRSLGPSRGVFEPGQSGRQPASGLRSPYNGCESRTCGTRFATIPKEDDRATRSRRADRPAVPGCARGDRGRRWTSRSNPHRSGVARKRRDFRSGRKWSRPAECISASGRRSNAWWRSCCNPVPSGSGVRTRSRGGRLLFRRGPRCGRGDSLRLPARRSRRLGPARSRVAIPARGSRRAVAGRRSFGLRWTDRDWRGVESIEGQVLYELHVGTFTPEGPGRRPREQLPHLAELGRHGARGHAGRRVPGPVRLGLRRRDLFAPSTATALPTTSAGSSTAPTRLGLAVILDVVYNHLGPDGDLLKQYSDDYFSKRHKTEWGEALNFDGENAGRSASSSWPTSATGSTSSTSTACGSTRRRASSTPARSTSSGRSPGGCARRPGIVGCWSSARTSRSTPGWSATRAQGGLGFDMLWSDDFHHAARVAATGSREAYYGDYLGSPQELVSVAQARLALPGPVEPPPGEAARHAGLRHPAAGVHHLSPEPRPGRQLGPGRAAARADDARPAPRRDGPATARPGHADALPGAGVRRVEPVPLLRRPGARDRRRDASRPPEVPRAVPQPGDARDAGSAARTRPTARRSSGRSSTRPSARGARTPRSLALHRDLLRLRREDPTFRAGSAPARSTARCSAPRRSCCAGSTRRAGRRPA